MGKTTVIDPEFAFYGPMGFDTGAFVGNMFLAYVSQPGLKSGDDYAEYVLQQVEIFWTEFCEEFKRLWNDPDEHTGYLYALNSSESTLSSTTSCCPIRWGTQG